MSKINFFNADQTFRFQNKSLLKEWIEACFRKEKRKLENISYIFCSDEYLLEINKQFLNHDYYTDIITFDLSDSEKISAEIYISLDRVKDNAISLNVAYKKELLRVLIHGALHLCGYKDKQKKDTLIMREKEEWQIEKFYSLQKKS